MEATAIRTIKLFVAMVAFVLLYQPAQVERSEPSVQLNNQAEVQAVEPAPETEPQTVAPQQPAVEPQPAAVAQPNTVGIPERVFCGSPAQRTWKTPNAANVALGRSMATERGWVGSEWTALLELYACESSWNHMAGNPDSGACGIPQSWPCSKLASTVPDWRNNVAGQIAWGYDYITRAYGRPSVALAKHYAVNWY